uniref:Candidate secreted effector n=1 Tax=Meloidogyne incognita TaxID=6306 RepID=A0A914L7D6_MELIC
MSNNNQQNGVIPSIMSQSVVGNFAFFENEKEGKETSSPTKLVHLAKNRPKPARLHRKKKLEETEEEEAVNALDEVLAKEEVDLLEQTPIINSSPEPFTSALGQSLERSPLLLQQRLKNVEENQEEKEEQPPPPIPSKRGTSCENSIPPKLPPKPSPPMGDVENRRNKLLDEEQEDI